MTQATEEFYEDGPRSAPIAPVVLARTANMSRREWLRARRKGIGGSDVAAILGLNPYKSAVAVYLDKVLDQEDASEPSEAARWGNLLEDVIAKEFALRVGIKTRRKNAMLRHPQHPWMIANIDRETTDGGILEIKTTGAHHGKEWELGHVPDAYALQGQHYLAVTGKSHVWFAALIGGQELVTTRMERDEALIEDLIKVESDFWALVEKETPPEIDGSHGSTELLKRLYPESHSEEIVLPLEADYLMRQYLHAQAEIKTLEATRDTAANQLKALLGTAERGRLGDGHVTWKTVASQRLDTKALKTLRPEVYEEFARDSSYRRFDVRLGGDA